MSKKVLVIISLYIILLCVCRSDFIGISKSPKTLANTIELPTNMPAIYVEPSNISASPGETFTVSIKIFNLTTNFWQTTELWERGEELGPWVTYPKYNYSLGNLAGLDVQLGWDETVLKFVSNNTRIPADEYSDGILYSPILKIRDNVTETSFPYPQPEESKYWLSYLTLRVNKPFNGNGTVVELTFEVLREGATYLNITSSRLADQRGEPIPHKWLSGFFSSPAPIYIRADGSIDPPTANITTMDNVTYTFTDNNYDKILVERSNIIIDGAGYTLQGSGNGTGTGFKWTGINNVTLLNSNIRNFYAGICLDSSSNCSISGNTIANNELGIMHSYSSSNSIQGNTIGNNEYGIVFSDSSYTSIQGNNITANNWYGISLDSSSNCSISGNTIGNSYYGIYLFPASNCNSISGNTIGNNQYGIRLDSSSSNSIQGNTIGNNQYGIDLDSSSSNSIQGNTIGNNEYGIDLYYSSSNRVFHNNLVNNTIQLYSINSVNICDDDYPSGGNYWSDYSGFDFNQDGIGDTPYVVYVSNTDNYPLMGMFSSFNTSLDHHVNVISNSTIVDFTYFEYNSTIRMHVSNMTGNQTHGFVRITIPHALMTEPYNVTIDGANPTYWNYTLYDNGTHRWIYFEYEHSTLEIILIPEAPSLIFLPFLIIAAMLAVLVYTRKKHNQLHSI